MGSYSDGRDTDLFNLIEEIYRTGSERHDWPALLGRVAKFVGAHGGILGVSDVTTGNANPEIHFNGLDLDPILDRWIGEFDFQDPWASTGYAPVPGRVISGAELRPLDELRALPLYSTVLEPLGIEDCLMTSLLTTGTRVMFFALYHDRTRGLFGSAERERLLPLTPHLVRAAQLEMTLSRARFHEHARQRALDEIQFAIFAVSQGQAEPLNSRAEALVVQRDGLASHSGRLEATDASSDDVLQASIIAAGGGQAIPSAPVATPFPLYREEEPLPLTCWAVPVSTASESALWALVEGGGALLFVGDPAERPELATETVSKLFNLTPSEARLAAAIAAGETPREYAERQGIAENTARWTLKQVQSKLGVRRQLEIASVLIRAVPGLRQ